MESAQEVGQEVQIKDRDQKRLAEMVLKAALPAHIRKDIDDWFLCIGGALPELDFLEALRVSGLANPEVLWKGRNARTGHELAVCAVMRARGSEG